jgi:hypothetical protein
MWSKTAISCGEDWQLVIVSMGKNNHRKPGFVYICLKPQREGLM